MVREEARGLKAYLKKMQQPRRRLHQVPPNGLGGIGGELGLGVRRKSRGSSDLKFRIEKTDLDFWGPSSVDGNLLFKIISYCGTRP